MTRKTAVLVAVLVSAAALTVFVAGSAFAQTPYGGWGPGSMMGGFGGGMMGGAGGMMGGQTGGPVQSTSPSAARALSQQAAATATIDRQTNTITYHGAQVQIVALASPDTGPDMTWNVDGLVNPTIVIPKGAAVTVDFFNADTGTMHGWELTATPPPYQSMAMMYAAVALPGAFTMPVAPPTAQTWFGRTVQFTIPNPGTFYYICPVPGHAQKGMYGQLIVR